MADDPQHTLKGVLQYHAGMTAPAGEGPIGIDSANLREDLSRVDRHLQSHYRTMLILFVIVFIFGIAVVLLFIDNPKQASAVIAVVGISAGGAAKKLNDVGREIANLRL